VAHGKRPGSARRGWADEKTDSFSILLTIEGFASIAEQIVVGREGFVSRCGRIDFDDREFFLVPWRAMQNRSTWGDDFAIPDKHQLIFAASCLAPCAVTRNRENSIFQAPDRHGIRTGTRFKDGR
jgi:hypothetical protein